ncbi:hypothetical protein HDU87_004489 [Geranomyces variabilis]|uniref:Calponin-homology (CH) domain-containing protein n=1 Tax=Geranomyces variabilis TaxID=109894 RepID=A0AAD5TJ49_9FUNG|nr:hypothetical protein HDU87_004489 [Geranomyces variabilis]
MSIPDLTARTALNVNEAYSGAREVAERDGITTFQLHPSSKADPNVKKLMQGLTTWVNSYVIIQSMTVRDLISDLDDGQVLAAFLTQITGDAIVDPQTLAARSDRSKLVILQLVVKYIEGNLKVKQDPTRWTTEGLLSKDYASALCLLVDLARVLGCPYVLPPNVSIAVVKREQLPSGVKNRTSVHKITGDDVRGAGAEPATELALGPREDGAGGGGGVAVAIEPDAFDKLFAQPEKVADVTKLLLEFVNSQLEVLNIRLNSLIKVEGVYLILLIGTLGNFFVPLHHYSLTPTTLAAKIDNARFALSMMSDLNIDITRINATDVVRKDPKSIARCLYLLFQAFRKEE